MKREFRTKAQGLSDLLQYAVLVDEGICLLKNGSLLAGFAYRGHDFGSAEPASLSELSAHINQVFCQCGDGWMLHVDMLRLPAEEYCARSASHFPDPVSRLIDEERRCQHAQVGAQFESRYVMLFTYQTPSEASSRLQQWLIQQQAVTATPYDRVLSYFRDKLDKIEQALSAHLFLQRLDSTALLTHLHTSITGLTHPIHLPRIPVYLDTLLASQDVVGGLQPKIGNYFIQMISMMGLPLESEPAMLDVFEQLPLTFRWSNRFIFLDPATAHRELAIYRRNWFQKRHGLMGILREVFNSSSGAGFQNRDALAMTEDADAAIESADSALVRFGYYTSVVVLMDASLERLTESAKLILKELSLRGFTGRIETVNALEAYCGSLGGHGTENVRKPLIHSLNLADLLPLTSVWAGLPENPCRYYPDHSPPLLYAKTTGNTPFRLHLHVKDVAHTFIKGITGAGKSTLVLTLIAQFFRYQNAQVFLFDKGYSAYPLCRALQGSHYAIGSEERDCCFYPLAALHEPDELAWASEWVECLLTCQHVPMTPDIRQAIRESLLRLQQQPSHQRTLTALQNTVQHRDIQSALEHYTLNGAVGHLLDADQDSLRTGHFHVFEMQHLLSQGEACLTPVLAYLFHQIDKRLTQGHPSLIIIEEGHAFLSGQFGVQLETWLLEKRKQNTGVVFIDQGISKLMQSPYAHTLLDSCQTKIFLPDSEADSALNAPLYRACGLNDREIALLKYAQPKQHYYVTSVLGRRLIELELGNIALSFVGVDSCADREKLEVCMREHQDEWVYHWLSARGLPDAAAEWQRLAKEMSL